MEVCHALPCIYTIVEDVGLQTFTLSWKAPRRTLRAVFVPVMDLRNQDKG